MKEGSGAHRGEDCVQPWVPQQHRLREQSSPTVGAFETQEAVTVEVEHVDMSDSEYEAAVEEEGDSSTSWHRNTNIKSFSSWSSRLFSSTTCSSVSSGLNKEWATLQGD